MEVSRRGIQAASTVIRRELSTELCSVNDSFMMAITGLWFKASFSASRTGEINKVYTDYNAGSQWPIRGGAETGTGHRRSAAREDEDRVFPHSLRSATKPMIGIRRRQAMAGQAGGHREKTRRHGQD